MTELLAHIQRGDPRTGRAVRDLTAVIGNTPMVRLRKVTRDLPSSVEVYAKAEWFNPGGSVKDRPALRMILEGIRSQRLNRDRIILDATSGNTGIGYALIGATLGFRVRLCVPKNATAERQRILRAYGAELILTDALDGSDGAIREARRVYDSSPGEYFYPDQYGNPANWRAHYDTTAPEIWQQTEGRLTHFVAGLGTTGTFTGVSRRLKELNPRVHLVAFQPDSPIHGLDGIKHMPTALVPAIYDPGLADENLEVSTDEAYVMLARLAREEGLLVGVSAAAAVVVSLRVARGLSRGVVVTVLPDSADRYLGERFWEEI